MSQQHKPLPIDVATFEIMITDGYLYIDKTKHIYDLYGGKGRYYFLARPRRFGKSLLVSTLKELFSGNKKLFEGLWIDQSDWGWKQHPVIHLDFSTIAHETSVELKADLIRALEKIGNAHNIDLSKAKTPSGKLQDLVEALAKKEKVVILIDEYDKPIIDHITNTPIANKNRDVLKSFYEVIKGLDEHLRAIFVTGVSKFSKTSIFSGINNLNDISQDPIAASLLGYTQQEVEDYLTPYITEMAATKGKSKQEILDEMKEWYNGYRFSEAQVRVYNPFSVLYYLTKKKRANYWFASGTPTFLMKLLKSNQEHLKDFSGSEVAESELGPFELENIPILSLLYQTGYLTIVDSFAKGNTDMYRLAYPNAEVRESFSKCILVTLTQLREAEVVNNIFAIKDALVSNDIAKVCEYMRVLFAKIPSKMHIPLEHYYQSLFLNTFNVMGFDAKAEDPTDKGFIDMVITTPHRLFVIEFKFNKPAQTAFDQINQKEYYQKYLDRGLPITLAGIAFNYKNKKLALTFVEKQI